MVEYDPAEGDNPGEPVIGLASGYITDTQVSWLAQKDHPPTPSKWKPSIQQGKKSQVESCIYVFRAEAPWR